MKIIEDRLENIIIDEELFVALGTFDGIHLGHRKIMETAVKEAKKINAKSAVLTFDKHPLSVLKPDKKARLLTNNIVKSHIIESLNLDYLIYAKFDTDCSNMEPLKFIEFLCKGLKAKGLICGYNYTFGRLGTGNTQLLNEYKDIYNYKLIVIEPVTINGDIISSSLIRNKFRQGLVEEANMLLGYNYFFEGHIKEGKKLGRKLGFPTANIIIDEEMCIKNGVYITSTIIEGKVFSSISNVGHTPTIENNNRVVETFIFNFDENLYGKNLKVQFHKFIREERKFDSIEKLKLQVSHDIKIAKEYFSANNIYNKEQIWYNTIVNLCWVLRSSGVNLAYGVYNIRRCIFNG